MGHSCGDLPDGIYLCTRCRDELVTDLEKVEPAVEAIWAAATRMNVGNGSVGTSGHSAPSEPTNSRAYDTGRTLNVILTGWADTLGHREPHAVKAANLLITHMGEVLESEWAPDLKRELAEVLWQCDTVTDRTTPKVFAGICPTEQDGQECGTPVYAREGSGEARCNTCATTWDVTEWRARALQAAGYHHGTPAELSRMLTDPANGFELDPGRIRQWVFRGKLLPTGVNKAGRAVYSIADTMGLWAEYRIALMQSRNTAA